MHTYVVLERIDMDRTRLPLRLKALPPSPKSLCLPDRDNVPLDAPKSTDSRGAVTREGCLDINCIALRWYSIRSSTCCAGGHDLAIRRQRPSVESSKKVDTVWRNPWAKTASTAAIKRNQWLVKGVKWNEYCEQCGTVLNAYNDHKVSPLRIRIANLGPKHSIWNHVPLYTESPVLPWHFQILTTKPINSNKVFCYHKVITR